MSLSPLLQNTDAVWERARVLIAERPILQAWPAVGGLLLIAPGMFAAAALGPHAAISHVSGLNLDIAYAPVAHLRQPTTLVLTTMSVFGTKGNFSLRIGKKLLENFSIISISPEPLVIAVDGGENNYRFLGGGKDAVTFTLMPKHAGRTAATLQYGLDPPIAFTITTVP